MKASTFLWLLAMVAGLGLMIWIMPPREIEVRVKEHGAGDLTLYVPYQTMGKDWRPGNKLGCEAKGVAVIYENPELGEEKRRIRVTAGYGTDKMALARDGDTVTMLTSASVAIGTMRGTPFKIVGRPTDRIVIAVSEESSDAIARNMIVLDETTGNAMWVRGGTGFGGLTGRAYFLECR